MSTATPDVTPVASSPTPEAVTPAEQAIVSNDVAAFRAARRQERPSPTSVVASSATVPAVPVPSTEGSTPASEPGSSVPAKKNAESRIQELLTERAQLRADLEAARRPIPAAVRDGPTAASPAPAGIKFQDFDTWIQAQPADVQTASDRYEQYIDARAGHVFQQQHQAQEAIQARAAADREGQTRLDTYRQAADQFVTDHADYWAIVTPITQTPPSATADAIGDIVLRSANPPQLLYHLGAHLEEFHRLLSLPPHQAAYELGSLAGSLQGPAPHVRSTLTRATTQPTTLGRKAADPSDPIDAAVASGDVSRFRALKLQQRLALTK